MRRFFAVLGASALLLVAAPSPAGAWWEIIEQLSGPGPFKGWSIEPRLVCFVEPDGPGPAAKQPRTVSAAEAAASVCKLAPGEIRLASIDVHARFVWREDDPDFANGERINLTTLAPAVTWNIAAGQRWDVVDYGVAGGVYWFTSKAFPSFRGAFFEPVRLEFHAPSFVREKKWAVFVPRARIALLNFPAGFDTSRFAASPAVPPRIGRDWVRNYAVFFDLQPLVSRIP
jgi:hypothetical protein